MRRSRLAALVLLLLSLVPAGAAAQSDCTLTGIGIFDSPPAGCEASLDPTDPTDAEVLKAAQARWDAVAAKIGRLAARFWLGPRPSDIEDLWWVTIP